MAEVVHGEPIKLYNVNKRKNSTHIPNEVWFYLDPNGDLYAQTKVVYKQPTNILQPVVILAIDREDESEEGSGEFDSYWVQKCNYAKLGQRYYWIREITSVRRDHWQFTLDVDPLATWVRYIKETRAFVEYWNGANLELIDTRLPRRTNGSSSAISIANPWGPTKHYIVGVITETGFKFYKLASYAAYQTLMTSVTQWLDTVYDQIIAAMPADPKPTSTAEDATVGTAIGNSAKDTIKAFVYMGDCVEWLFKSIYLWIKAGFSKDKIASFLTTALYYPCDVLINAGGGSENIKMGNFDTGISGTVITQFDQRVQVNFDVFASIFPTSAYQAAWGRRQQFVSWSLYIPYFGVVALPADLVVAGSSIITIEYNTNITTGACNIRVALKAFKDATSAITLETGTIQIGSPINIGFSANNFSSAVSSGVGVAAGAVMMATGNTLGGIKGLAMAAGGAMTTANNAMHFGEAITPIGSSVSGASGGVRLLNSDPEGMITLTRYSFDVSEQESNMAPVIGVPCFQVKNLSSVKGYVKCNGASVSGKGMTGDEMDIVNAYLNNGMYIED